MSWRGLKMLYVDSMNYNLTFQEGKKCSWGQPSFKPELLSFLTGIKFRHGHYRSSVSKGHPRIQEPYGAAQERGTSVSCPLSWAPVPCEVQTLPPEPYLPASKACFSLKVRNRVSVLFPDPWFLSPLSSHFLPPRELSRHSPQSLQGDQAQEKRHKGGKSLCLVLALKEDRAKTFLEWEGREKCNHLNTNCYMRK